MEITIYLSKDATSFKIIKDIRKEGFPMEQKRGAYDHFVLSPEEANDIHPLLGQIASAKDEETVIAALQAIQANAKHIKTGEYVISDEKQSLQVSLLHMNGAYEGHDNIKGAAHVEPINAMIAFASGPKVEIKPFTCCMM